MKELQGLGLRFKKNVTTLLGTPDIVFPSHRVAVFCDGDFWHGRYWTTRRRRLSSGTNADYWIKKIEANRRRDSMVSRRLKLGGWRVVRVWESEIHQKLPILAEMIRLTVLHRSQMPRKAGR